MSVARLRLRCSMAEVCGLISSPPRGRPSSRLTRRPASRRRRRPSPIARLSPTSRHSRRIGATAPGFFSRASGCTPARSAPCPRERTTVSTSSVSSPSSRREIPQGQEVIANSDNLSTRTTQEVEDWLGDHPGWRFVFSPKHASWLNQVEIFSLYSRPPCAQERRLCERGSPARRLPRLTNRRIPAGALRMRATINRVRTINGVRINRSDR